MDTLRHLDRYGVRSWIGEESDHVVGFAECPICGQLCEARHRGISARMLQLLAENSLQKHMALSHLPEMAAAG